MSQKLLNTKSINFLEENQLLIENSRFKMSVCLTEKPFLETVVKFVFLFVNPADLVEYLDVIDETNAGITNTYQLDSSKPNEVLALKQLHQTKFLPFSKIHYRRF